MPTYGAWTQDADYAVTLGAVTDNRATNVLNYVSQLDTADNLPPIDESKLQAAAEASGNSGFGASGPVVGRTSTMTALKAGWDFQGGGTYYHASRTAPLWGFSAWQNDGNLYRGVGAYPPGAVGIEWEGGDPPRSQVVGASLNYSLANPDIDDTNNFGPTLGGSWDSNVLVYTNAQFDAAQRDVLLAWDGQFDRGVGYVLETWHKGGGTHNDYQPSGPFDVTGYLYGGPKDGWLALSIDFELLAVPKMASYSLDEVGMHIGAAISGPQITYTLRPPRYRFLYPGGRPAYNRIVQRGSDGFGMTGGKRIFQNRTMQSTNRRGAAIR